MDFMTTKEVAELWGISVRRVQVLCDRGKVEGAKKFGAMWIIPKGTPKPIDGRTRNGRRKKQEGEEIK